MPKASELHLGFEYYATTDITLITCNDLFCPCDGEPIMHTEKGTYLNLNKLDRAINLHLANVRDMQKGIPA